MLIETGLVGFTAAAEHGEEKIEYDDSIFFFKRGKKWAVTDIRRNKCSQ